MTSRSLSPAYNISLFIAYLWQQCVWVNRFFIKLFMKVIGLAVVLCCVIASIQALKGVDVSELFNLDTFQCFVRNGAQFAVVQAYTSYGYVDSNALQNLKALKNLGLRTDIFMRSCRSHDAAGQVNDMMDSLPGTYYDTVWVYVEKNSFPSCDWSSYTAESNCAYLNSIAMAIINRGKNVGFYSSVQDWSYTFKNINACPQLSKYPLWYEYGDDLQSFNNFRSFGGWNMPSMKRYSVNYNWCGTESTNLNFRP